MARVACLFSVEYYDRLETPLTGFDKIPYGLSVIAACLEHAGHEVRCWVITPDTPLVSIAQEIVEEFDCEMVAASPLPRSFLSSPASVGRSRT